jgi:Leucine-rich repeat (LRR) protein
MIQQNGDQIMNILSKMALVTLVGSLVISEVSAAYYDVDVQNPIQDVLANAAANSDSEAELWVKPPVKSELLAMLAAGEIDQEAVACIIGLAFAPTILEFRNGKYDSFYNHFKTEAMAVSPHSLKVLANLRSANFAHNGITVLPMEYFIFNTNLTRINLSSNNLSRIPPRCFAGLRQLAFLDLSNNHLRMLEEEDVASLEKLVDLNLSDNWLKEIPTLSHLVKLAVLNVGYNRLTKLPPLPAEVSLVSRGNLLKELPNNVSGLLQNQDESTRTREFDEDQKEKIYEMVCEKAGPGNVARVLMNREYGFKGPGLHERA